MPKETRRKRGPLPFKQSDLERAIRAAKKTGAGKVWIAKDGTINISVLAEQAVVGAGDHEGSVEGKEIVL
ncbi:MAG: hypothetical protein ACREDO_09960 [Methyloceanibacter sp.]